MKKILCVILVLVTVMLAACGSATNSSAVEYGDQSKFLSDMAKGIQSRLEASDKDDSSMTEEEISKHYLNLVGLELKQIEKYADVTFADARFNTLAHEYISACQMQKTGAENYRNKSLYDSLWSGGRTIRSGIITFFYENYNLPISAEEASSYSSNGSGGSYNVSYSTDGSLDLSTGLTMYSNDMVTYDEIKISKDNSQVLFDDQNVVITLSSLKIENSRYTVNMIISNSRKGEKVACYLSAGYADDFKVDLYHTYGYEFVEAGKKGSTSSYTMSNDFEAAGIKSFKTLQCALYVISTSGDGKGYYLAKIALRIDSKAFH